MSDHDSPLHPIEGAFTDVFDAVVRPPQWVIENLLPPGLVFIGAPPKSYKSTFTMAVAALVAGYKCTVLPPELSKPVCNGPTIAFSYEADAGELRHMLEHGMGVRGQADGGILICDDPFTYRLDEDGAQEQMMFWLNERKPKVVILDPLRNFHSLEEKDSAAMVKMLGPLRRWAVDNQAAFIVVHHTRKVEGEDATRTYKAQDMRGSSAIFGLADAVLMFTPNARVEGQLFIEATFKRAAGWSKMIQLAVYNNAGTGGKSALSASEQMVLNAVEHGYDVADKIAQQTGLAMKAVQAKLMSLYEAGRVTQNRQLRWVLIDKKSEVRRAGTSEAANTHRERDGRGHSGRREPQGVRPTRRD